MHDELGYARFMRFESGIPNVPGEASRLQKAVNNLLSNVDFSTGWTFGAEASGDAGGRDTSNRCLSLPTYAITKTAAGTATLSQTVPVSAPGRYTFSAYVKTAGFEGGAAHLKLTITLSIV